MLICLFYRLVLSLFFFFLYFTNAIINNKDREDFENHERKFSLQLIYTSLFSFILSKHLSIFDKFVVEKEKDVRRERVNVKGKLVRDIDFESMIISRYSRKEKFALPTEFKIVSRAFERKMRAVWKEWARRIVSATATCIRGAQVGRSIVRPGYRSLFFRLFANCLRRFDAVHRVSSMLFPPFESFFRSPKSLFPFRKKKKENVSFNSSRDY